MSIPPVPPAPPPVPIVPGRITRPPEEDDDEAEDVLELEELALEDEVEDEELALLAELVDVELEEDALEVEVEVDDVEVDVEVDEVEVLVPTRCAGSKTITSSHPLRSLPRSKNSSGRELAILNRRRADMLFRPRSAGNSPFSVFSLHRI